MTAMREAEIIADTECAQVVSETVVSFPQGFDEKAGQATTCSRQEPVTEEPTTFCKELDCVDDVSRGRHDTKFLPEGPFHAHRCRGTNVEGLSPNVSKDERHEKRPRGDDRTPPDPRGVTHIACEAQSHSGGHIPVLALLRSFGLHEHDRPVCQC